MYRVIQVCFVGALLSVSLGCGDDALRPVWIASATPNPVPVGAVIVVEGKGFGAAEIALEQDGPAVFEGLASVSIGGVTAPVYLRQDRRLDVEIPALAAGTHDLVIFTAGVASNAYPITVLATITAPDGGKP